MKKSSGSRSRKQRLTAVETSCADHVTTLYLQKLALTSPTGGGRSVGIVRVQTKATEFSLGQQLRPNTECSLLWDVHCYVYKSALIFKFQVTLIQSKSLHSIFLRSRLIPPFHLSSYFSTGLFPTCLKKVTCPSKFPQTCCVSYPSDSPLVSSL